MDHGNSLKKGIDRRTDKLLTIPNAIGAVSVSLAGVILAILFNLTSTVARLEAYQESFLAWRQGYNTTPWSSGPNVDRWLDGLMATLVELDKRLAVLEEKCEEKKPE